MLAGGDFVRRHAEDEDIVFAYMVQHFDIGAVQRANGQRAVQGKFHIARARGFKACCADLFGNVGSGDQDFRHRDIIVRQEDDL